MCPRRLLGAARFVCAGGRGGGLKGMWVGGVCSCPAIGTYGAVLFRSAVNLFFYVAEIESGVISGALLFPPAWSASDPRDTPSFPFR